MLKQTSEIVSYLIIALFFGIIITLIADSIENVTVEKRIRQTIEDNVRNAVASFKDSAPDATAADERAYIKKYAANVMGDKIVARERSAGVPPQGDADTSFLFTLRVKSYDFDFYLQNAFLKSELAILDIPDYISGIVTTIIVFTFILVYVEHKKRTRSLQQQFELKHEELRTALEKHEALALLGRMSAALAHELKTPLSTISNLIHVLPTRLSDERFTERFVTLVREELDRTQQLIDNLLAYGKNIELRNEEWMAVPALMFPAANRYNLTVIPNLSDNEEIRGDRFYLDLFFQNVFRNSREAGASEVRVAVRIAQSAPETMVDFTCEDNGVGYPEIADLDELMSPFVTSRSRGSGLGLYLAKKIITAHDGTLSLYRKEKGAGVKVTLPGRRVRTRE
jgi:signal transduction histidine kinase